MHCCVYYLYDLVFKYKYFLILRLYTKSLIFKFVTNLLAKTDFLRYAWKIFLYYDSAKMISFIYCKINCPHYPYFPWFTIGFF